MRARGFLLGATAGRTTLNGEGLQHEDGHSHLLAGAIPNCRPYDPTFGYEVAVILQEGMQRMLDRAARRVLLPHADERELRAPGDAGGRGGRHHQGHVPAARTPARPKKGELRVQLLGSGTILREAIAAAELLDKDFGVNADIWSCPSFTELRRDGFDVERWNRLHPEAKSRASRMSRSAGRPPGPGHRRDRLRARLRRPDPRLRADALHRPGHRWVRPLGYARQPAPVLRGRPLLHRPCGDRGAGGRGQDECEGCRPRDQAVQVAACAM